MVEACYFHVVMSFFSDKGDQMKAHYLQDNFRITCFSDAFKYVQAHAKSVSDLRIVSATSHLRFE